ncbi:class I SAM-dependent methyltransferase [Sphingobacteriales bacterium UPWRP_1]|nr:SAM-dependent methyltransferase [Sphingobacteriales bacterium TSM_CSS]PSJ75930.1 class I SAM-dependent methyltransferase [Sphingobacteriales bacterium UPWRP_1]
MYNNKLHWETVYQTKPPDERSWTQVVPEISLHLIHRLNLPKTAPIIDIGGGDSLLADFLLEEGFTNITVLDISATALLTAQQRLGSRAANITWIASDVTLFNPPQNYQLWHDRATFHFLTTPQQIEQYVDVVNKAAAQYLIIGTFSETGPKKCSGLDITQYNETSLPAVFAQYYTVNRCQTQVHTTPFNTGQNFIFCTLQRR